MGLVLIILGGMAAVAVGVGYLRPELRMKRLLRHLRQVDIADARDGYPVFITGTLGLAGEALTAPLTGRRCAAYRVVSSPTRDERMEVDVETRAVSFFIRDETGKALVTLNESPHDRVIISLDRDWLEARGEGDSKLLHREGVLREGTRVVAAGIGHWEPDLGFDPRALVVYREMQRLLVLRSTPRLPLQVSDSPEILSEVRRRAGARS